MNSYRFFHEGEVLVQRLSGTDTDAYERQSAQMMQPEMSPSERQLIERLTFSTAGTVDDEGRPWASPLLSSGAPLFRPLSDTELLAEPTVADGDPLRANIAATGELSVLFFEAATRRRAKSIGRGSITDGGAIHYSMHRLFGLCPKYIFRRTHRPGPNAAQGPAVGAPERRSALDEHDRRQLTGADTVFIASHSPHGADVTHRGGPPGFIEVVDDNTIAMPDYVGNGMYNTFGNLVLDDRLALTDIDRETGRVLHLTGRATVTDTGLHRPSPERVLSLAIEEVRLSWAATGTWVDVEASRYNPADADAFVPAR